MKQLNGSIGPAGQEQTGMPSGTFPGYEVAYVALLRMGGKGGKSISPGLSRNKLLIKGYHCKRNKTTPLQHLAIVKQVHGGRVRERASNVTAARPL